MASAASVSSSHFKQKEMKVSLCGVSVGEDESTGLDCDSVNEASDPDLAASSDLENAALADAQIQQMGRDDENMVSAVSILEHVTRVQAQEASLCGVYVNE